MSFKPSFVGNGMPIVMEVKCGGNFTTVGNTPNTQRKCQVVTCKVKLWNWGLCVNKGL